MKRIEFIGASGVGKTTLFNTVLANRTIIDNWITPEEARVKIVKSLSERILIDKRSIKIVCIKANIFKKKHASWATGILQKYENKVFKFCLSDYNCLVDFLFTGLNNNIQLEPIRKAKFIEFYYKILVRDIGLLDYFNVNDTIVYHDGIIHNNSGIQNYSDYNEKVCKKPKVSNKINPIGVIYCKLSLDDNFNRRKHRIANSKNKGTIVERNLNDKELYDLCERSLASTERKANVMKSAGIPVLVIDTSLNTQENVNQIFRFIRDVQNLK